mgnify:CR=1 FL=1
MSLTPVKKSVVQALVGSFETGRARPDYGAVSILNDRAGISYGRFQATDRADTLDLIVHRYVDLGGTLGTDLRPFLDDLDRDFTTKVDPANLSQSAKDLMDLLRRAGTDPAMHAAQDQVFDEAYWVHCEGQCNAMEIELPLSWAAVFDVVVQSGPGGVGIIRRRFPELPPVKGGNEIRWALAFMRARRDWIASFVSSFKEPAYKARHEALVRKTVYRADALLLLAEVGNWDLKPPFLARGVTIQ